MLNSNIKTIESFDGTHIQYDSDGDVYFKALVVVEYLSEMKTHFTDIIEQLRSTILSWKMKLIVGVGFKYDDKKVKTEIFIND